MIHPNESPSHLDFRKLDDIPLESSEGLTKRRQLFAAGTAGESARQYGDVTDVLAGDGRAHRS